MYIHPYILLGMTTKVQKWGNSLAVRLPSRLVKRFGLKPGSRVFTEETEKEIIIRPLQKREETLDDLLARVTSENIHPETNWGKPVGREIW
ncbi:MAG: transcriptional regulator/antitoxin MazE [Parcubacteria group bacterium GW2011_GWF2_50_9]|nr:MAG: transcriptional regulator/antitoxin MazE [Parcubacteria group bacterium GW2011_GWF2_50_9]